MIGQSRESINKPLAAWLRENVIEIEDGAIVILDEAALRGYGET